MNENQKAEPMGPVIQIDEARIRDHPGEDGARYSRGHHRSAPEDAGKLRAGEVLRCIAARGDRSDHRGLP